MKSKLKNNLTKTNKHSRKSGVIIFCSIMTIGILFFSYMTVLTYLRGSKNLEDLTHISGSINQIRIIKHKVNRQITTYKDVIVLRIDGSNEEFGFIEDKENYRKLLRLSRGSKALYADVYYDRLRKRIEQNVTLHTFELTINGEKYVDIRKIKRTEYTGSIIFFISTLALTIFTILGVKTYK